LRFLRDELRLTGAKNGCDGSGTCGACTVLVDGAARKSCQIEVADLDGARIVTIEGLADGRILHPVQEAFIARGAVQCGFCTPGMVLATVALLDHNPAPTREEIVRGLSGNLCRCTGYAKIVDAVQAVVQRDTKPCLASDIGAPLRRPDALGKVTGATRYADDCRTDEDLVLRVVWAPEPHARIAKVRVEEARSLPAVVDVLTASDVPGANAYGPIHRDQPVLCGEVVRCLGDPIALVIAENDDAATAAVDRVHVEVESLPTQFDPLDALDDATAPIHPDGNLACEYRLQHGNVDDAFESADLLVSGRFETPAVEHAYLEPDAGFAEWDEGTVVVHAPSQYPQTIRDQLASVLDVPNDRVRVVSPPTGGAFGGRTDISVHALLALAAWHTRRRVRLTWSRSESLRASVKRHPMTMDYRMAFDSEGTLLAVAADLVADIGAYESLSHPLLEQTAAFSSGPYRVAAVDTRVRGVYTNGPVSSAFRGFGIPQPTFAVESLMDEAAARLDLSPIEIRRRNLLRPGDRSATGQRMHDDTHIVEALEALVDSYESIRAIASDHEGVGIACGYKNIGLGLGESDHATATLTAAPDGTLTVAVGAVDIGQGSETVLGQLAADRLGTPTEQTVVRWGDTADTPDGRETNASRQTVVSGNAVVGAAARLEEKLCACARNLFPELREPVRYDRGLVGADGKRFEWDAVCAALPAPIEVSERYVAPDTRALSPSQVDGASPTHYFAYTFFAHLAHLTVDAASGRTMLRKLISAFDVGRVINRQAAEGQIEGGAAMGIGFALSETYVPTGENRTTTLAACGLPRAATVPPLETRFLEFEDSIGPHGAKGIGEVAMIAIAPAITNAIRDAVGVRVHTLPAAPQRLKTLLANDEKRGGE